MLHELLRLCALNANLFDERVALFRKLEDRFEAALFHGLVIQIGSESGGLSTSVCERKQALFLSFGFLDAIYSLVPHLIER